MENVKNTQSTKIIKCPNCGSDIEVHEDYVQWCEHCLWNVKPFNDRKSKNVIDKIYKKLGERFGNELFESMLKSNNIKPKMNISKFFAYVISAFIISISIFSILLLIYLFYNFGINMFIGLIYLFLLGLTIATFPRFRKLPKNIISRSEFPALYKLLDDIAEASNSPKVYGIVIDDRFNAAFTEIGVSRKKIVYIGLPLFYMLNNKEKVAVLSHEIGHGVNGDITRGIITSTALNTLRTWYRVLYPSRNRSILTIIPNLMLSVFSKVIYFIIMLLLHLMFNDSQRAEYLADYIGATVGGTEEMISMLDKLHLDSTYVLALQRAALSGGEIRFFDELALRLSMIPKKEFERIRIVSRMEGSSLDSTHPPTANRIKFLEGQGCLEAKVKLSEEGSLLIEKELSKIKDKIEKRSVDRYNESLFY